MTKALQANTAEVLKSKPVAKRGKPRLSIFQRILKFIAPAFGKWGCTLWTGAVLADTGYPMISDPDNKAKVNRMRRVQRVLMERKIGRPLKRAEKVLHDPNKCSCNRRCVNIEHLYVGTPADNTADALQMGTLKGRKLSPAKACAICAAHDAGATIPDLATEHGVYPQAVRFIVIGKTYSKATGREYVAKPVGHPRKVVKPVKTADRPRAAEYQQPGAVA